MRRARDRAMGEDVRREEEEERKQNGDKKEMEELRLVIKQLVVKVDKLIEKD